MSKKLKISIETTLYGGNSLAMHPDENGCFNIIVGATNVFNSAGAKYIQNDKITKMFSLNSSMMKRVKNGEMQAERGHPMPKPGMSSADYLKRVYLIDADNIACDILDLKLSVNPVNLGKKNTMVYPVYAKIKPSGPHGDALYESLTDPESDTAFSVRSITVDYVVDGITHKEFKYIINYDWVHAPGIEIAKASMWKMFALEAVDDISIEISLEDITSLEQEFTNISGISLENKNEILTELKGMFNACTTDDCIYKQWR